MSIWNARPATTTQVDAALSAAAAAQASADASAKKAANLADLTSAATARNSIGVNQICLETRFESLVGAVAQVRYLAWPFPSTGGFAIRMIVTLEGALLTGDATIAVALNGVATLPATLTLTQAGSAAGSKFTLAFSGSNTMPADGTIALTVGGTNTAPVGAGVEFVGIF